MVGVMDPPGTRNLSDYVRIVRANSPAVHDIPHGGRYFGDAIGHKVELERPEVMRTAITGIDHSVSHLTDSGVFDRATVVWTELARAIVDVNRGREDYDQYSVEGGPSVPKSQGVIWNATIEEKPEDIKRMLPGPYTRKDYDRLMELGLYPYEDGVRESMRKAKEKYGIAILWNKHSVWGSKTSTVQSGLHEGAYLIGKPGEVDPSNQGQDPDLYFMHSGDRSCPQEFRKFVMEHFTDHGLVIVERQVASTRFDLAHRKYANLEENWYVFSTEYRDKNGYERNREKGEINFEPDPNDLKKVRDATIDLEIKLNKLIFPHQK